MADILVHRPARTPPPGPADDVVSLSPPPSADDAANRSSSWTYALFPLLGSGGILVFALVNGNPLYLIAGGVFVLGAGGMGLAMFLTQRRRGKAGRLDHRQRYFDHLADTRARLREDAGHRLAAVRAAHPDPHGLCAVVDTPQRLWERRPGDHDFLVVRLGTARVPSPVAPRLGDPDPMRPVDLVGERAARRLVDAYGSIADAPVAVPLGVGVTTLVGDPVHTRPLARAMLAQLVALHAPDDVRIAVCCPDPAARADWEWVKWLPHAAHPTVDGGEGGLLLAADPADLVGLLRAELDRRRAGSRIAGSRAPGGVGSSAAAAGPVLLVVVDGAVVPPDPLLGVESLGVRLLRLVPAPEQQPSHVDVSLRAGPSGVTPVVPAAVRAAHPVLAELTAADDVRADALGVAAMATLARRLAPLRLSRESGEVALSEVSGLPELLGIGDVAELDPAVTWAGRSEQDLLRVPLGVDADGRPVHLDLKESALSGMGPHGLAVGATGSGKSELLRTLVVALAVTHSPEDLALVLVDFKGGATFAGLTGLPHVAGLVTDLEDDPGTVERVGDALRGELRRREELLRDSGDLASIREHRRRRLAGADVPPMPHLLVVIDEFSELLVQQPEMIDLFVAVGRLGRSLGVHLLLATQRLEEGRLRGLESHLSYRLALRTFSSQESRIVLGNVDAFELPAVPGSAYLKVDTTVYERLRVATVSAPYVAAAARSAPVLPPDPRPFDGLLAAPGAPAAPGRSLPAIGLDLSDPDQRSTLDVVVGRLRDAGEPVHQVWLPPLPGAVPLAALVPDLVLDDARGVRTAGAADDPVEVAGAGPLRAPVAVVDLPERQEQTVLSLDLSGSGGHVGVAGGPQSGKSTLLRTLITSLAVHHTPEELQVYVIDLGGGVLAGVDGLPHVGGVAGRTRPDRVVRLVAQLTALVDRREATFAEHGIDSVAAFRRARAAGVGSVGGSGAAGGPLDDGYGEVLLVVDGWMALRTEFEDLEAPITALAARGLGYGLHVAVSAGRWWDVRPALRDALGTKLELALGDPGDSVHDRASARRMPGGVPGRVLVAGGHVAQAALPHLGAPGADADADGVEEPATTVSRIAAAWTGRAAPPVMLLPARLDLADLLDRTDASDGSDASDGRGAPPLGLREVDLAPLRVDLLDGPEPHLLVLGDAASGRSATLRTVAAALTARYSPDELRIIVVDYRRSLLDAVGPEHLSVYCGSAPAAAETLAAAASKLAARLPGPDVTVAQLRQRSWWAGPRMVVLVDDHDLVATPSGDPLAALVDLLPQGRDIGLHVVLARRASGAATASSASAMRRLRELGAPGLILSGAREEGVLLHGVRARALPPGRAQWAARGRAPELVQVAWTPPPE